MEYKNSMPNFPVMPEPVPVGKTKDFVVPFAAIECSYVLLQHEFSLVSNSKENVMLRAKLLGFLYEYFQGHLQKFH